jgi:hypothetical protein
MKVGSSIKQLSLFAVDQRENFWKRLGLGEDVECPCCRRMGRQAKLKIHSTLAFMLVKLYRSSMELHGQPTGWVHLQAFSPPNHTTGRDFSITKHWLLAEPKAAGEDEDKRSSGMWRLTDYGVKFVEGKIRIPVNMMVFDDKIMGVSDDVQNVEEALGNKFSYKELFSG